MALAAALRRAGGNAGQVRMCASAIALILAAAAAAQAEAQVTPPRATANDESKQDTGQLEQVTVTARYTKENLQTTPVAITAVTGEDLQDRHLVNVTDLGKAVPNLFVTPGDANEGLVPTISMRGVSAGDSSFAT